MLALPGVTPAVYNRFALIVWHIKSGQFVSLSGRLLLRGQPVRELPRDTFNDATLADLYATVAHTHRNAVPTHPKFRLKLQGLDDILELSESEQTTRVSDAGDVDWVDIAQGPSSFMVACSAHGATEADVRAAVATIPGARFVAFYSRLGRTIFTLEADACPTQTVSIGGRACAVSAEQPAVLYLVSEAPLPAPPIFNDRIEHAELADGTQQVLRCTVSSDVAESMLVRGVAQTSTKTRLDVHYPFVQLVFVRLSGFENPTPDDVRQAVLQQLQNGDGRPEFKKLERDSAELVVTNPADAARLIAGEVRVLNVDCFVRLLAAPTREQLRTYMNSAVFAADERARMQAKMDRQEALHSNERVWRPLLQSGALERRGAHTDDLQ